MRLACAVAIAAVSCMLAACQYPRDPEDTLDYVQGDTLRVGVIDDPPWVDLSGKHPSGVEPELLREFAAAGRSTTVRAW